MVGLTRALGAATAAYSAVVVAAPAVLAKPCGMTDVTGRTPWPAALLVRAIGVRDTAIGVGMMTAPPGPTLTTVTALRVVADAGDAVAFGVALPDDRRLRIAGFAAVWAVLNAVALGRDRPRAPASGPVPARRAVAPSRRGPRRSRGRPASRAPGRRTRG